MSIHKSPRFPFRTATLVCLVLGAPLAGAASHCKGVPENACASDDACTWVSSYTRSDGRTVSGHCKLRRGKKAVNVSAAKVEAPARTD